MAANAKGVRGVREQVGNQGVVRHRLNESHAEGGRRNAEDHVVVRHAAGKLGCVMLHTGGASVRPFDGKELLHRAIQDI